MKNQYGILLLQAAKTIRYCTGWLLDKYEHADGKEILFEKRTSLCFTQQKAFESLFFKYNFVLFKITLRLCVCTELNTLFSVNKHTLFFVKDSFIV